MAPTRREFACGALACAAFSGSGRAAIPDPQTVGASGIDLKSMDRSIAPGDDFFRYVNGAWLRDTPIPSDRGRWVEFTRLDDLNTQRNRAILEAATSSPRSPEEIKLGDFYASLMDENGIEARGLAPLKPELARVAAVASPADLARALAQLSWDALPALPGGAGAVPAAPAASSVLVDIKNPTRYLPGLGQGGIGLPDRDYFLIENNPGFAKARAAYRAHLAAMFRLAGMDDVEARAARVYALEERIAQSHWTRVELRDPAKALQSVRPRRTGGEIPGTGLGRLSAGGRIRRAAHHPGRRARRHRRHGGGGARRAAGRLARLSGLSRHARLRAWPRRMPSSRKISPSRTRRWPARRNCRCAGSARARSWTAPWAMRWAASIWPAISRRQCAHAPMP